MSWLAKNKNIGLSEIDTGTDYEESAGSWRPIYQKTINCGKLPNIGVTNTAHGISNLSTVLPGYPTGTFNYNGSYRALPYASDVDAQNVRLIMDATNVTIVTAQDWSDYTGEVQVEYTKTTDTPTATPRYQY